MGVHLIDVRLIGVYFMGVYLTGVRLPGVHHRMQPFYPRRPYVFAAFGGRWLDVAFLFLALSGNLALGPIAPGRRPLIPSTLGHKEGVGNAFNSSAMVLGAPRFSLPGHFDVAGNLCTRKIYPR